MLPPLGLNGLGLLLWFFGNLGFFPDSPPRDPSLFGFTFAGAGFLSLKNLPWLRLLEIRFIFLGLGIHRKVGPRVGLDAGCLEVTAAEVVAFVIRVLLGGGTGVSLAGLGGLGLLREGRNLVKSTFEFLRMSQQKRTIW